jgi:hypothetical protein
VHLNNIVLSPYELIACWRFFVGADPIVEGTTEVTVEAHDTEPTVVGASMFFQPKVDPWTPAPDVPPVGSTIVVCMVDSEKPPVVKAATGTFRTILLNDTSFPGVSLHPPLPPKFVSMPKVCVVSFPICPHDGVETNPTSPVEIAGFLSVEHDIGNCDLTMVNTPKPFRSSNANTTTHGRLLGSHCI